MKRTDIKVGVEYAMYPRNFSPKYDKPSVRVRVIDPHVQRTLSDIRDNKDALHHGSAYGLSGYWRCNVLVETVEAAKFGFMAKEEPAGTRIYVPARAIADTWVGYQEKTRQAEEARKRLDRERGDLKKVNTREAKRLNEAQVRHGMTRFDATRPMFQFSVESHKGTLYTIDRPNAEDIDKILALLEGRST